MSSCSSLCCLAAIKWDLGLAAAPTGSVTAGICQGPRYNANDPACPPLGATSGQGPALAEVTLPSAGGHVGILSWDSSNRDAGCVQSYLGSVKIFKLSLRTLCQVVIGKSVTARVGRWPGFMLNCFTLGPACRLS